MPGHKDWILKALNDVKLAKKIIKDDDEFFAAASYHIHQSVEKSLKAILVYHHQQVPKIHDLEYLLELCVDHYFAIGVFEDKILSLELYELKPRYPDDYFSVDRDDVERGIQIAEQVLKVVSQYLQVKI